MLLLQKATRLHSSSPTSKQNKSLIVIWTLSLHILPIESVIYHRFGKTNITETHADGFYCGNVTFPAQFQGKGRLRVFPSTSFESIPVNGNEASVVIVDEINDVFFSVCVMEPAQTTGLMTINWFAFSDRHLPPGTQTGSTPFSVFTSGSTCTNVTFPQVKYIGIMVSAGNVDREGWAMPLIWDCP